MKDKELILSMQRKVIGGYMNAAEMALEPDRSKLMIASLDEHWFDNFFHRVVVKAMNKIKESGAEVCDLNVLHFLSNHNFPKNLAQEQELNILQAETNITARSFADYITAIKRFKALGSSL